MSLLVSRRALMALAAAAAALPVSSARAAPTPPKSAADTAFDAVGKDWLETSARLAPIWAPAMGDHR